MKQVYHITTRIYTAFAQNGRVSWLAKLLYMFARSFDEQNFVKKYRKGTEGKGSGKVELDISLLARTFNRSIETIKKNLRLAHKLGLFWLLEIKGDRVRLVYSAFTKVCAMLGISDLGAIYETNSDSSEEVRSLNIRFTIAQKQKNAQQAAIRTTKEENVKAEGKRLSRRVVKPNRIFKAVSTLCDRPSKASGIKAIKKLYGRFLVVSRQFVPYGVSQETIAGIVDRTPQTVRKHLKSIKGLPNVDRFQVCTPTNDAIKTQEFWLDHHLGEKHYMRFDGDRTLYIANTNIYDLENDADFLMGCHGLRKRVSKATRKAQRTLAPLVGLQA